MADADTKAAGGEAAGAKAAERGSRRLVQGVVRSAKMQQTIVVEAEALSKHPKYGKYVRKYTVMKAHDEKGEAKEGDVVEIAETRPLSKTKRYRLVRVLRKAE